MSDTFSRVEVITGVARRRRFSTDLKLAVVAETMQPGMSVSYVARRHGLSPSLVFRRRRLMSEGGREAVRAEVYRRTADRGRIVDRCLDRHSILAATAVGMSTGGSEDAVPIQAAIDYAASVGGATIYLGADGFATPFAHQPPPAEHQAGREPVAARNIADRHAGLH